MSFNEILMSLDIGLIYGVIAMGIYTTFRVIDFPDLTCDGSFVVGSAVSSVLTQYGYSPWLSVIGAFFSGSIAGLTTGMLHTQLRMNPLLSGILVHFMLYSINLRIMGGIPNICLLDTQTLFYSMIPTLALVCIVGAMWAMLTFLFKSDFGLALRVIGSNKTLAQTSGVRTSLGITAALCLSNALVALGGALWTHHQGFSDIGSGVGTVIVALASVIIGEKIWPVRSIAVNLARCILGSIVYRLLITFALHTHIFGLTTQDLNLVTGLMIVAIMATQRKSRC